MTSLKQNPLRLYRTPYVFELLYPKRLWRIPTREKVLYLTFDDGPTHDMTSWILDELEKYNAPSTFFCVGQNVEKYPGQWEAIQERGHRVGNHTHKHVNGWKSRTDNYLEDISACANLMATRLFRPPYGRITSTQAEVLLLQGYRIVMWSVLTHDFDPRLDKEKAWQKLVRTTKPGDIIVFHDSHKAKENLQYLLPRTLEYFSKLGYRFATI